MTSPPRNVWHNSPPGAADTPILSEHLNAYEDAFAYLYSGVAARAFTPAVTYYGPSVQATYPLVTGNTIFDAANIAVTFKMPPSGRVLIHGETFIAMTALTTVYFTLNQGGTNVASFLMCNEVVNSRRSFSTVYADSGSIGVNITLALGGFAGAAGNASVLASQNNGYPVVLSAQPI